MKLYETIDQVIVLLRNRGRVAYRALAIEFSLDENSLAALKEELIEVQELAVDQDGKMLVWVGAAPVLSPESRVLSTGS